MRSLFFLSLATVLPACGRGSPAADADLGDGLPWLYANFNSDASEVADVLRVLEARTYATLDVDDNGPVPRSLEPFLLDEDALDGLEHPGRDLAAALPMAVARLSDFGSDKHADVTLMPSQVPVEPYSPDLYDRVFLEGEDCWRDHGCEIVRTDNDLIKKNALMEVRYQMRKDFRWIDLSEDETPRWAIIARSWVEQSAPGEGGKSTIQQAYSIEFTIPRDGRGFVASDADEGVQIDQDSDASGSLRLQALWSETTFETFEFGDDVVKGTIRTGIDKIFKEADDWLHEQES